MVFSVFPLCSPHRLWRSPCAPEKSCSKNLVGNASKSLKSQNPEVLLELIPGPNSAGASSPALSKAERAGGSSWQGKISEYPRKHLMVKAQFSAALESLGWVPLPTATLWSREKSAGNGNSSPFGRVLNCRTELMEAHAPRELLWRWVFDSSWFPRPPICPSCRAHVTGWLSRLVGKTRRLWDRLMKSIVLLQGPVLNTLRGRRIRSASAEYVKKKKSVFSEIPTPQINSEL